MNDKIIFFNIVPLEFKTLFPVFCLLVKASLKHFFLSSVFLNIFYILKSW